MEREDGWRAFRICGVLDFSLIGILAGITQILADRKIGLFAISTYNTDYVLTKEENFESAVLALKKPDIRSKIDTDGDFSGAEGVRICNHRLDTGGDVLWPMKAEHGS